MISKDRFATLSDEIVHTCFPQQVTLWRFEGERIVDSIIAESSGPNSANPPDLVNGDLHFVSELSAVLGVATETVTLTSALISIYNVLQHDGEMKTTARERLITVLEKIGVAGEKVSKIITIVCGGPNEK